MDRNIRNGPLHLIFLKTNYGTKTLPSFYDLLFVSCLFLILANYGQFLSIHGIRKVSESVNTLAIMKVMASSETCLQPIILGQGLVSCNSAILLETGSIDHSRALSIPYALHVREKDVNIAQYWALSIPSALRVTEKSFL